MDLENMTMEEKCENLMNIVVESRKRSRKRCIDYGQKCMIIENKMLKLQLENISKYRFKNKNKLPRIDFEDECEKADKFAAEVEKRQRRIQEFFKTLKDTQEVVCQLEHDKMGRRAHMKLTADNLLRIAKEKNVQK